MNRLPQSLNEQAQREPAIGFFAITGELVLANPIFQSRRDDTLVQQQSYTTMPASPIGTVYRYQKAWKKPQFPQDTK